MTAGDLRDDPVMQALAGLAVHGPDPTRAMRIRKTCDARLGPQRGPAGRSGRTRVSFTRRIAEPTLVVTASAVFLFEVLRRALQLYGF